MKPETLERKPDSLLVKLKQEQCEKLLFRENSVFFILEYDLAIRRFILCDHLIRGYFEVSESEKMKADDAEKKYLMRSIETAQSFKKNFKGTIYVLHAGLTVPLEPPIPLEDIIDKHTFKGNTAPFEFHKLADYVMKGLSCS